MRRTLAEIITCHSAESFVGIKYKVDQLVSLNQLWMNQVDSGLAAHTRVANFRDNCLVIEVDNAGWALHLRYALPGILQKLKSFSECRTLVAIDWYIAKEFQRPSRSDSNQPADSHRPAIASRSCAQLLEEVANNSTNERLRQALRRLARGSQEADCGTSLPE